MRLHNFFVRDKLEGTQSITITDSDLLHQWSKVFRLGKGDRVVLLDNSGFEFECVFTLLTKKEASLSIEEKRENTSIPGRQVHMYLAVLKKDNFELVLQKGTELGVTHFHPILTSRTEKQNINVERAEKIVREASEQSGRGTMPTIVPILTLGEVLDTDNEYIALHMDGEKFDSQKFTEDVSVLVGPEGGWSDEEIALFKEKNIPIYSLGNTTLRAETAAIAISTLLY
ncbi:hypothetical protein COB55_02805 [Candidatus Wolfebacteria bacterium]|nr:MAG: hypothetical protein COB55_02805 [Candidatus Wolfebacteria bacterium]